MTDIYDEGIVRSMTREQAEITALRAELGESDRLNADLQRSIQSAAIQLTETKAERDTLKRIVHKLFVKLNQARRALAEDQDEVV